MKRLFTVFVLLIAYQGNSQTNYIPDVMVSTLAGIPMPYARDGQGTTASFNNPAALAIDASGNIYVADAGNNEIRKITSGGLVSTIAGTGT